MVNSSWRTTAEGDGSVRVVVAIQTFGDYAAGIHTFMLWWPMSSSWRVAYLLHSPLSAIHCLYCVVRPMTEP